MAPTIHKQNKWKNLSIAAYLAAAFGRESLMTYEHGRTKLGVAQAMMSEKAAKPGKKLFKRVRSPCADAHYEAFILQSKWTVDNLYASNVNLGQEYIKRMRDMEKQRRTWLTGKDKEQQTVVKRMSELQTVQRTKSAYSAAENSHRVPLWGKFGTPVSRHASLEKLTGVASTPLLPKLPFKTRSVSQPCGPASTTLNSLFENRATEKRKCSDPKFCRPRLDTVPGASRAGTQASRTGRISTCSEPAFPLKRNTFSASTPSLRWRNSGLEDELSINTKFIPKYIPSALRSKNSTSI